MVAIPIAIQGNLQVGYQVWEVLKLDIKNKKYSLKQIRRRIT